MTCDVLVVGAGPAGAWAAYRLAQAGARVTLFDPTHPREKPCGGGVTGRALELIAEILPRLPRAVVIAGATFERLDGLGGAGPGHASGGTPPDRMAPRAEVPLPTHGLSPATGLVVASRRELDGALLGAAVEAGARLVPERVVDIETTPGGVVVRTVSGAHRGSWLLGADGAGSLVRRRLLRPFTRSQLSIAAGVFAHGATSGTIDLACLEDPPGYLWSFPRPDHLAIGIGCPADRGVTARCLQDASSRWLAKAGLAPGARLERYGWPIPSLAATDLAREQPSGSRWMLLGDAAGLVDPLTREGIYFALLSGAWAAEALSRAPGQPEASYAARLRDEIHPELAGAARLRDGFFRADFLDLLLDALAGSPPIATVMADLVAGRQPYRGLRRRLLLTREWRYAWRLARLQVGATLVQLATRVAGRAASGPAHRSTVGADAGAALDTPQPRT